MKQAPTNYQKAYIRKVTTFGFYFLAAHLPALLVVASWLHSSSAVVIIGMVVLLAGPALVLLTETTWEYGALSLAVASMGVSALAIHVSGGFIEAHFEIFALIAMLTIFGRVLPLLVAATVIALHHLLFWLWLPASVFYYKAGIGIVLLHAFHVVFELIPACWLASQFGRSIQVQGIVLECLSTMASEVESATAQVEASGHSLAASAMREAASVAEISHSTQAIQDISARNVQGCDQAARVATETAVRFQETNRLLEEMVSAMDTINASSKQISGIVKATEQIAFQTNILALNAAVEAARAGETGLGFAVVAEEVRNLAQRSADAAKQTAELIGVSIANSTSGITKASQVADAVRGITDLSNRLNAIIAEIHRDSQAQAEGIRRVTTAAHGMDTMAQTTASTAEENSAAAAELTAQAHSIRHVVNQLTELGGADSIHVDTHPTAGWHPASAQA